MTTNIMKKAAEATNSNGPHTDTNNVNFPTSGKTSKAIAPPLTPSPNKDAILAALTVLIDPADVVELRALTSKGRKRTDSGYFDADHWDDLAEYAKCLSESGSAVYITLNPVDPQLLSRYSNRLEPNATSTTTDKDVTRRRWLLIDLDPVRPSGTSATATQLEAAANKARVIHSHLVDIGWPKPVAALSGNGYHMLYAIDLPNDAASTALVKNVLLALGDRFDDALTKVDRTVFNAGRICKLPGTVANKGDHTAAAPWRRSCLMDTPARVVVTETQLAMVQPPALAAVTVAVPGTRPMPAASTTPKTDDFILENFFARHSMAYTADLHDGRERFKLAVCPFNSVHVNGEAAVLRKPSGELGFKCQHDSCASYHWQQVRELLDGPQQAGVKSVADSASNAMLTGQFVTQNIAPNDATSSEDMQRLRGAIAVIPATASLATHSAEQVIGKALRHVSSGIDEDMGKALCGEWDALTSGAALTVFNQSDPHYSATKPLGLPSVYSLAQMHGWSDSEPWSAPTPLPDALPLVMPFDENLLPVALRAWVMDIAHRMQCPPDFSAVGAIAALSSLIGARAVVQPKQHDNWQVVPNLWALIVGRPGVMKSPALGEAMRPLNRMETTARELFQAVHESWELDCKVSKIQDEENGKKAKGHVNKGNTAAARQLLTPSATPPEPTMRSYVETNTTMEALGVTLQQNPWGLIVYRDEIYSFLTTLDSEENQEARGFYLQGYDGAQGYKFKRITRGETWLDRVCIAMLGGIQPGKIQRYVRDAVTGGNGDDGLLQRFGLTVWPDIDTEFKLVDQWPDTPAQQAAWAVFERLAQLEPASDTDPVVWRFSPEAQALFYEWLVPFETEIRSDDLHPAMVSHLAKYRKLIPAMALIFALVDTSESGCVIHEAELIRALAMGNYLRSHANRLYAAATTPETNGAVTLLTKIKAGKLADIDGVIHSSFTPRQVSGKHWSGLGSPAEVRKAAELLVDYDYLRPVTAPMGASGGRPSQRYAINPAVLKDVTGGAGWRG
jgi:hypothetical protein